MIVAAYVPENPMNNFDIDFIVPEPTFSLLGSYETSHVMQSSHRDNNRIHMGTVFLRVINTNTPVAGSQIVEVYLVSYQGSAYGTWTDAGRIIQFEKISFLVPSDGSAPSATTTYFTGGHDGTSWGRYFTANSVMVHNNMIYVGVSYEYDINDDHINMPNNR